MGESINNRAHFLCYWLTFACTFFVYGCSHSLSPKDVNNKQNIPSDEFVLDFINPPISVSSTLTELNSNIHAQKKVIWQHIAKYLTLTEFYQHPNVKEQKQKFISNEEYLTVVSRRAEPFIHFILEELKQRQMPAELVALPIVESSYSPIARSHANAAGLWQFMSYTATEYGLERSISYDARYDVHASTHAALDYLSYLHQKFDGDWLLAMAAYNAGPQRVKRAQRRSKGENKSYGESIFWQLKLPLETRRYVPKILALSAIIKDKNLSNNMLYPVSDEPYLASLEITKRITLSALANDTGVDTKELLKLNPALRTVHNPSPEKYYLLTPKSTKELVAVSVLNMPDEPAPVWQKYKVVHGDTLSKIANHYGTTITALREANNLHNNKIILGNVLNIPPSGLKYTSGDTQSIKTTRHKSEKKALKQNNISNLPYFYVVTAGDSFWEIANRNNTTVQRLSQINDRNPDQPLRPGESILID